MGADRVGEDHSFESVNARVTRGLTHAASVIVLGIGRLVRARWLNRGHPSPDAVAGPTFLVVEVNNDVPNTVIAAAQRARDTLYDCHTATMREP
jgi:hypothetical protein